MCRLCGTEEEKKLGREAELHFANDLKRMATYSEQLAFGKLEPHSNEMKPVSTLARSLIRELINDYL